MEFSRRLRKPGKRNGARKKNNHTKPTEEVLCGEEDRGSGYGAGRRRHSLSRAAEWSAPGLTKKAAAEAAAPSRDAVSAQL